MRQVFISYRRGSGLYMAKNIATYLSTHGYNVFFDYDSIENGVFDKQIFKAIEESSDFILVLTENSLDNCSNPNDWVLAEVLHAKRLHKNIILATDAERFNAYPDSLPDELDFLKQIDWTPVHPKLFEGSMKILISRLKSHSNKWRILYYLLISLLVSFCCLAAYLYYPTGMITANLDDDEDYPIEILDDYDTEDEALSDLVEDSFTDEITSILVRRSSKDYLKQMFIQVEDFEEIDTDTYGISEEELDALVKAMSLFSVREYYLQVKKAIADKQPQLLENFTPFLYKCGNFEWFVYRFLDQNSGYEYWRASAKLTNTVYINIVISTDKSNYISEKRFIVCLKRMLDKIDVRLMEYVSDEYS